MKHFFLIHLILLTAISIAGNPAKKFLKETDFVFIPSGSFTLGESQKMVSIHAFYMFKTEVTNLQYREFLSDLKAQNRIDEYAKALPDTAAWNMKGTSMQPYADYYFRHPAYDNYPVVNISIEGAQMYCSWLTEKLRKNFPDLNLNEVRLPTSSEWEYAASGGLQNINYSWGTNFTRNAKGECMGNFCQIGDERIARSEDGYEVVGIRNSSMGVAGSISDNADVLAPAQSYLPNAFGLYNMSGNAAELVYLYDAIIADLSPSISDTVAIGGSWYSPGYDVRISSYTDFKKANPFTGFRPVITYINREN